MAQKKEIRVNAFALHSPVHHSPGMWRHPRDRSLQYHTLDYWVDLARTLERGLVDALFMADSVGVNDVYGGGVATALRHGAQVPKQDPLMALSAMAYVTRDLGLCVTSNANHEPPYVFARRMSTLDNLTRGRIGWNIVTGFSQSGVRALGKENVAPRDERYDIADEYMDVVYKLWEGSWARGAVVRDPVTGVFADPGKVHVVDHQGKYFKVRGIHMTEPTPQRTPVLFQAGSSERGRRFSGRHAEGVYLSGPSKTVLKPVVDLTRAEAVKAGRAASDIKFYTMATIITGRTAQEARDKYEDYRRYVTPEAALAMFSGWTGIDFSAHDPDAPIRYLQLDHGTSSALEGFTKLDPDRVWTVKELALHNAIGGRGPVFIGSPAEVADRLEEWVDDTGVDGFNLSYAVTPEAYEDFADLVVPVLQERGRYKTRYALGTLREKLGGRAGLAETHPGAAYRR
ncbi:5,10-methylene tetrahydromethanopterin reductase [Bordetella genomosp. 10]|uniref:5,10-methylene tetrahydromethanopterin reductase n=1 Tax=Bordetella genomosp. 10 TaxID=1416804 RepID=A0A261SCC7_9BORD|nr:LLM class flavin-dependent oxidoreductase [Bordetella genomosp. 10]OZI34647.1 5,10-methylene tetrahydromethanopterin reductase [Bordetella genomosp. 10]